MRIVRRQLKQLLFHAFRLGQHAGVDILPRHFYSQVPDLRRLSAHDEWKKPRRMDSITGHELPRQLAALAGMCDPDIVARAAKTRVYELACERNGAAGYGEIEAILLYAFIARERPRKVVQVGCGVSTAVMLQAAADTGLGLEVTCIDPYPTEYLRGAARAGHIQLIAKPAQEAVGSASACLGGGDLLFVDSTHAVRPDSEVNVVVLDVLPWLQPGVWAHFHDITFPYDYEREILGSELFHHAESALLHAFLSCNAHFELVVSCSMLHYGARQEMGAILPNYRPAPDDAGLAAGDGHFPSATYIRRHRQA